MWPWDTLSNIGFFWKGCQKENENLKKGQITRSGKDRTPAKATWFAIPITDAILKIAIYMIVLDNPSYVHSSNPTTYLPADLVQYNHVYLL